MSEQPLVIVGVTGGIAAYKTCDLIRRLRESGAEVVVIPTASALEFVGETTFAALSGNPVVTDVWANAHGVAHVALARRAVAMVVAPATADFLARTVHGRANDLLAATLLTTRAPIIVAPAMHTEMWENPATVDNVRTLRSRGVVVLEPAVGRLTGPDSGKGRFPEPLAIAEVVLQAIRRGGLSPDLAGRHILVSAGGTREPVDAVRFLGNSSSGRQGYALAQMAAGRGARVTLVSANVDLPDPAGVDIVRARSAADLDDVMRLHAPTADAVIMTAAVADFAPVAASSHKLKKQTAPESITLRRTPDILRGLVEQRIPGQVIVGFAAETGDDTGTVLEHARVKFAVKGCDILVVNDVSGAEGFGSDTNTITILTAHDSQQSFPSMSKSAVADAVLDAVAGQFPSV